jgi:hypothetical protein
MIVIGQEYFNKEKVVELTQANIDAIIEELGHADHGLFVFMDYQKIIDKLKGASDKKIGCGDNIRFWKGKSCNLDCGTPNPYQGGYYLCDKCRFSTKGVKENGTQI